MLNSHPELHIRNEGWLFNDQGSSFETWFNRPQFNHWAARKEARGTWMRDITPGEAARLMQQAMLREVFRQATIREGWKDWNTLRWCGDKTTNFYNLAADTLFDLFPPTPASPHAPTRFLSMLRDGRDVVVSNLFLIFREQKWADLPAEVRDDARRSFEFHINGRGLPMPLFTAALLRFLVQEWIAVVSGGQRAAELYGPAFLDVRYESLVHDTPAQLRRIYDWLGVSASMTDERLHQIVEDCKFENFSEGRKRGQADPLAEWRKGIVGDWRNHFAEDDKHLFKATAGSLLIELGYEHDLNW